MIRFILSIVASRVLFCVKFEAPYCAICVDSQCSMIRLFLISWDCGEIFLHVAQAIRFTLSGRGYSYVFSFYIKTQITPQKTAIPKDSRITTSQEVYI